MAEALQERNPSYAVVRCIVRDLPASLLTLTHRGNKAYSEGFDLVHRREASKPNAIWQVDHAQLQERNGCTENDSVIFVLLSRTTSAGTSSGFYVQ